VGEAPIDHAKFSFMGRSVAIATEEASVVPALSALMDIRVEDSGPADYCVTVRHDGESIAVETKVDCKRYETPDDAIVALAQAVPYFLLPYARGFILHGGALIADGKAHLFLGPGFVGKSTIALEAWLMGYEVLGDDYLWLDPTAAVVQAVPKPLKLRRKDNSLPEQLVPLLAPGTYRIGQADRQWALLLSRGLPRMAPLHRGFPVGGIHLLERTDESASVLRPADKHEFVQSIFGHLAKGPHNNLDIVRCLSGVFYSGRVTRLRVGRGCAAAAVSAMIASESSQT